MPVAITLAYLEAGMTIDQLAQAYDGRMREQVEDVLDFAARALDSPARPR